MFCQRCQVEYSRTERVIAKTDVDLRYLCEKCRDREKTPLIKLLDQQIEELVDKTLEFQTTKDVLMDLSRRVAIKTLEASARQAELYGYRFIANRPSSMNHLATELRELKAQVQ